MVIKKLKQMMEILFISTFINTLIIQQLLETQIFIQLHKNIEIWENVNSSISFNLFMMFADVLQYHQI